MRSINGAISNDLERTVTLFSRSHHSLTLNISQTATDTATFLYRRRKGNRIVMYNVLSSLAVCGRLGVAAQPACLFVTPVARD